VTRVKILLIATMIVGAFGFVAVPKVWALFTAETSNMSVTAASGTFTMNLQVNGEATNCFSYSAGANADNVNSSCTPLRTDTVANELYPGDSATATVAVENAGSVAASDLRVFMPGGCTFQKTASAAAGNGGNPCSTGGWMFSIQETTSGTKCWYPVVQNSACPFNADTLSTFSTRTTATSGLSLGSGPAAQATRTFVIGVQVPSNAANTLQGEAAVFALAWHMTS
jgi:hypothetical protein